MLTMTGLTPYRVKLAFRIETPYVLHPLSVLSKDLNRSGLHVLLTGLESNP